MLGVTVTRDGMRLPRPQYKPLRGTFRKSLVSAAQIFAALLIGAGIFVAAFGVKVPISIYKDIFGKTNTSNSQDVKTNLVGSTRNSCTDMEKQTNSLFNTCPNFYVDFSGQRNGPVDNSIINNYIGAVPTNGEAEYYTGNTDNVRVQDGNLLLIALNQTAHGYRYTSGRIDTHGKEDFLYGKIVVRAEVPNNIGSWPAIWMLPSQPRYATLSPTSDYNRSMNDGEMDISESAGVIPHVIYGVAHSREYPEDGVNRAYFNTITLPDSDTSFHDYELDWTPTKLIFSVDGKPFFTYSKKPNADYKSWPFNQPFYLIMNLALGGGMGGTDTAQFPGDGVDKSSLPASLKIQNIRYYTYDGNR